MSALRFLPGAGLFLRRMADRSGSDVLRDLYRAPPRTTGCTVGAASFCALDLETTGIDPDRDRIVSFGLVLVRGLGVELATARHAVVSAGAPMPERSVIVHGITDDRAAAGLPLQTAMDTILRALPGHVLLAHHCALEVGFLDRTCRRLYGVPFVWPVTDTERIARRWFDRKNEPIRPGMLRLGALRERFGLPRYKAHDPLMDAIGAAELLAALVAHSRSQDSPLRTYLCRG